ncbi:MAG: hypothetical protein ABSG46_10025, partial [Candidatus Binataceae bacterium]
HLHTPGKGQVVIFNRSHYEEVLTVSRRRLRHRSKQASTTNWQPLYTILRQGRPEAAGSYDSSRTRSSTACKPIFKPVSVSRRQNRASAGLKQNDFCQTE